MFDGKGEKIEDKVFKGINEKGFQNGLAIVEYYRDLWGVIDTNGHFVVPPKYHAIHEVGIIGQYLFFGINDENRSGHHQNKKYGIATLNGDTILQPMIHYFSDKGFENGLLISEINDKFTYINQQGEIVWQEQKVKTDDISVQDIDFMNEVYLAGKGAHALKDLNRHKFPKNEISVKVTRAKDVVEEKYKARKVFIVNKTDSIVLFNAQDGRLNAVVQALDRHGNWKDIEYLPRAWCGNSYHTLSLEANQAWELATAIYTGSFNTKLRLKVAYVNPEDNRKDRWERKENIIYSNEYKGSINPAQFWRKIHYYSRSLMNPYDD